MAKSVSDFRRGTKQRVIAEFAARGVSKKECYAELRALVERQERPMIFRANVAGHRIAKPIPDQLQELKYAIGRIYALMGRAESKDFESEEIPQEEDQRREDFEDDSEEDEDDSEDDSEDDEDEDDSEEDSEDKDDSEEESSEDSEIPKGKGKQRVKEELEYFLRRVREIRGFCRERARLGEYIDAIGIRPAEAAAKLIPAGIPADVLLLVMTMHWSPATRAEAGIDAFDFNVEGQSVAHPGMLKVSHDRMRQMSIEERAGKHELFGYVLTLIENDVDVMLVGPMGTGKSFLARQISEYLGCDYGETGMAAGASRGDLLGRYNVGGMAQAIALQFLAQNGDDDAAKVLGSIASGDTRNDFTTAEFETIYSHGGIFNFEEIDRADPGVVVTLNNALAGKHFHNSVNGQRIVRNEDTRIVATANTFGLGASATYTSAERMDQAVMDRFRMGRAYLPLDEALEEDKLFGRI